MSQVQLDSLRKINIFQDFTMEQLTEVQRMATMHTFERGYTIFMEGHKREFVFFILRGLVKVFQVNKDGRQHIVNILGAGEMFPHIGFFSRVPYPGTAQTMNTTTLLSIRCTQFDAFLEAHEDITHRVMDMMSTQISRLQLKVQELSLYDSRHRVIALLRHLAEEHGKICENKAHVRLPLTHSEMAQMIGVTRESVNRVWSELRREGIVTGRTDQWDFHFDKLTDD